MRGIDRAVDDTVPIGASLRPFPYPFRAALSLCNDADLLTPQKFRRLHRFLSTDDETEWGPGLGMDVGGSFFMFRSPNSPNEFTVFDHLTSTITDDGEFILEYARRGLLDVLHTYGCYTDSTHFTRRLAETALEVLRARGIQIETWVNHGPPTNVQCLGRSDECQGDAVGTAGYHADLTIDYGFRWIWTGSEMTDWIALDASKPPPLKSRIRRHFAGHPALVEPHRLRDGQAVRRFYRYTGIGDKTPVLEDLPQQLSKANLDELVDAEGYAIVYQHLAVRRVRPGFGTGVYRPTDEGWFTPGEISALQALAQRYHDGEIWVVPTTSLLRYRDAYHRVRWSAHREEESDVIVVGPETERELADLTFYCERPEATRVYLQTPHGLEQIEAVRPNPTDATSRRSVTLLPRTPPSPLP